MPNCYNTHRPSIFPQKQVDGISLRRELLQQSVEKYLRQGTNGAEEAEQYVGVQFHSRKNPEQYREHHLSEQR